MILLFFRLIFFGFRRNRQVQTFADVKEFFLRRVFDDVNFSSMRLIVSGATSSTFPRASIFQPRKDDDAEQHDEKERDSGLFEVAENARDRAAEK